MFYMRWIIIRRSNKAGAPGGLFYDKDWGGLPSRVGYNPTWHSKPVLHCMLADFGNSCYNDHHYHFGYFVVSAAILAKLKPSWTKNADFVNFVDGLIRDTSNPSSEDPYFPRFRHFDWFDLHSWSRGLAPNPEGKDEESTSEEMNLHYGIHLWGKETGRRSMQQLGATMLAMATATVQEFFLMAEGNPHHPADYARNRAPGMLLQNKAHYATYFGKHFEYIHGIQMIPLSPALTLARTRKFNQQEWSEILCNLPLSSTDSWTSILLTGNLAMIDPQDRLEEMHPQSMDDGLTKAYALYWTSANIEVKPNVTNARSVAAPSPKEDVGWGIDPERRKRLIDPGRGEQQEVLQMKQAIRKDDDSSNNMLAQEPIALVDYRHHRSKEEQVELGRTRERHFLGGVGASKGEDIRLHGRWMELSTRAGEDTAFLKSVNSNSAFHPGGNFRVIWDVIGLCFLSTDAIMLPLTLAFEMDMSTPHFGGTLLTLFFWSGFVYWCSDIIVNFNTAVYSQGQLIESHREIAYHYLKSWLLFDMSLIILDIVSVSQTSGDNVAGDLSNLRALRVVRALRLLRLLKVSKLKTIIQEMVASTGRSGIVFMLAILNTAVLIIFMIHVMTCVWYGIGQASIAEGKISWIDISMAQEEDDFTQYMHSLRYVINAPSPPLVAPDNLLELSMAPQLKSVQTQTLEDTAANILGLIVLGSAVSKISQALAEMRANSEEDDRQRREIRLYLNSQNAPFELVSRIMKFVDYRLEKMSNNSFDSSLISKTLQTELYVNQRNAYLVQLPIFSLSQAVYPDVFAELCACLSKDVFEKFETVYMFGSWAKGMVMTLSGTFSYVEQEGSPQSIEGTNWFEEASLYVDGMLHNSTLATKTFGETFVLDGEAGAKTRERARPRLDLVHCLVNSPGHLADATSRPGFRGCTRMFMEYARDFVANLTRGGGDPFIRDTQMKAGEKACLANLHYQELYQDPRKKLEYINTAALVRGAALTSDSRVVSNAGGAFLVDAARGVLEGWRA
ncbi:3(4)-beta-glucanase (Endo-1 [Durusdinium trenchii]|uniref:glucan endo-1,3-beta-D-glucosidase n=1 Tax=Durusdinium trenchii TaxID=1381693 RepID=A0ABP0M2A9_9DINO